MRYRNPSAAAELGLCFFLILGGPGRAADPHPLTTVTPVQGGRIVYGTVDRAESPGKAMAAILDDVGRTCGERPKVGRPFRLRGGGSVAVFFTVTSHAAGGREVAGMVLAAPSGPRAIDAALVSDDAARFPKTLNPMLKQLFAAWHPKDTPPPPDPDPGARSRGSAGSLRPVASSDRSATVGLPPGWTLDPRCNSGMVLVHGPDGELLGYNIFTNATNTNDPLLQRNLRMGIRQPRLKGVIYYPYSTNVAQNLPGLYREWKLSLGQQPPSLQVESVKNLPSSGGVCAGQMQAHLNPDGKGMQELNMVMNLAPPTGSMYKVVLLFTQVPVALVERDRDTITAILTSVKLNQQVIGAETQAAAAVGLAMTRQATEHIKQDAAQTMARIKSDQTAHEQQWAGWHADQDVKARRGQEFSNYILDQKVVQDNNMYNNSSIGHGTLYNADADWLVKHHPDRFEYVDWPNYWEGTDYHR